MILGYREDHNYKNKKVTKEKLIKKLRTYMY